MHLIKGHMILVLDQLPFDVLFIVGSHLHLDDLVRLGQTCRRLHALLEDKTVSRHAVETYHSYTHEAKLARKGVTQYPQALQAIYSRRQAFEMGYPFSARILGHGSAVLFRHGVAVWLEDEDVCVLDVRNSYYPSRINLTNLLRRKLQCTSQFRVRMLHFSDQILAVHVVGSCRCNIDHLFAIGTANEVSESDRFLGSVRLPTSYKLFVRHDEQCLYYGTHTGMGDDGHHKWEVSGFAFTKNALDPLNETPLLLENFHGNDIGLSVAFEVHNGYFHAVSNHETYAGEDTGYTSFYHWLRFHVRNPIPELIESDQRVFRRHHGEGPINDQWTELNLQTDERTNELAIVEARREWVKASSRQSRTFYTTIPEVKPQAACPVIPLSVSHDEPFALNGYLTDSTNPSLDTIVSPPPRLWQLDQHRETPGQGILQRSFIHAKTKFKAYNYSCSAFVDLVEDDQCCHDSSSPPCLRLRIGSRREASGPPGTGCDKDEVQYAHTPITLWPPRASRCPCSKQLHDIMNRSSTSSLLCNSFARTITAILDDRSLVILVKLCQWPSSRNETTQGRIIFVDFSPGSKFQLAAETSQKKRVDSLMDSDNALEPLPWQWQPGLGNLCKAQMC